MTSSAQLGARLGFTTAQANGNNGLWTTTGTAQATDTAIGSAAEQPGSRRIGRSRSTIPTRSRPARRPLQREPAGAEPRRQHRARHARLGLSGGPGAVGGAGRGPRRGHFLAARHHGEPEGSDHRAGYGNPVPGVGLQRRDHDSVQEGGAVAEGDAADHSGQPHHPRPRRQEGQHRYQSSSPPAA